MANKKINPASTQR
ncbi:hypothetical protein YPPY93_1876, partial [Yersinia pestis PY-93]